MVVPDKTTKTTGPSHPIRQIDAVCQIAAAYGRPCRRDQSRLVGFERRSVRDAADPRRESSTGRRRGPRSCAEARARTVFSSPGRGPPGPASGPASHRSRSAPAPSRCEAATVTGRDRRRRRDPGGLSSPGPRVTAAQLTTKARNRRGSGPSSHVGVTGFEPATFRSQSGRATNLRHTPNVPSYDDGVRRVTSGGPAAQHRQRPSVRGPKEGRAPPPARQVTALTSESPLTSTESRDRPDLC